VLLDRCMCLLFLLVVAWCPVSGPSQTADKEKDCYSQYSRIPVCAIVCTNITSSSNYKNCGKKISLVPLCLWPISQYKKNYTGEVWGLFGK
jgi:hypothetical protein